jgi:ribosome-associated toxin RatA of RatAB toxin-antitoxin module
MTRALQLTLALVALVARAGAVEVPPLPAAEVKQVEAGQVVVHTVTPTGGVGVAVEAFGVIDATSAEVFPVVRDCEHFWKFMPRTKVSNVVVENGTSLCHTVLTMPFPLTDLWSETRSELTESPAGHFKRQWALVHGSYKRNSGSFTVVPWGDGTRALVRYTIDSDPGLLLPDALIRSAQTGSLPEVFVAIRKRVVELRAR